MKYLLSCCFIWLYFIAAKQEFKEEEQGSCACTYPLKENKNWCKGPKGGEYCVNKKGTKTYKPKNK